MMQDHSVKKNKVDCIEHIKYNISVTFYQQVHCMGTLHFYGLVSWSETFITNIF
jgi:hypothetical protein